MKWTIMMGRGWHQRSPENFAARLLTKPTAQLPQGLSPRSRTVIGAALALLLLLLAPLATSAQDRALGIDCEKPRVNADGKLILGDDGSAKAACEADRSMALNYANVVRATRDQLRIALNVVPPPVWQHLTAYLQTNTDVAAWRYTDGTVLTAIDNTFATLGYATRLWAGGVLANSTIPTDWRDAVRARACGSIGGTAVLVVWLDPTRVRDRWEPEMVQRAVRVWLERDGGPNSFADKIPGVVTAAHLLKQADGSARAISSDPTIQACITAAVPVDALAMSFGLSQRRQEGRVTQPCTNADEIGSRRLMWQRQNQVYIVPERAINEDGSDHAQRGEALIGLNGLPSVTTDEDGLFMIGSSCREPRTLDVVRTSDCPATLAEQAVEGKHVRTYRFREVQNDPLDPYRVDLVPVGPGNGELGIIAAAGAPHPIWEETSLFCAAGDVAAPDAPDIPDREEINDTIPSCTGEHGARFSYGDRYLYRQTVRYPAGWPIDEVEVRHIDDDCFALDWVTGTETREQLCPANHTGEIIESRTLRWQNRDWAVSDGENKSAWNRALPDSASVADAASLYDGGSTSGWDEVQLVSNWAVTTNTCAPDCGGEYNPNYLVCSNTDGGNGGGEGEGGQTGSYDRNGDGVTDSTDGTVGEHGYSSGPVGSDVDEGSSVNDGVDTSGYGGDSDDSSDDGGGGPCFIVTALTELGYDSLDRQLLVASQDWRDEWLLQRDKGRVVADMYYQIAPQIIAAIPPEHPEWERIAALAAMGANLYRAGKPELTWQVYHRMVNQLVVNWLPELVAEQKALLPSDL
ncbi:MAG: hypothetical protein OXC63_08400 [Aestuariivita sp.]|nr:hypothetical protein [Aestuariivita sp.]MCY4345412.1 hypothetical protein [Aestuariivita sp.]